MTTSSGATCNPRPISINHHARPQRRALSFKGDYHDEYIRQHVQFRQSVFGLDGQTRHLRTSGGRIATRQQAAVFDALATAGVTHVLVSFDGYGDSGQIEHIEFKAGDAVVAAPQAQIEIVRAKWGQDEPERAATSMADAIEQLIYDILNAAYGGWEDNEGSFGEFIFDVAGRTITLDYNERYIESANHQQVF